MKEINELPAYMQILFNKVYSSKRLSAVFSDKRVVKLTSLGVESKIVADVIHDVPKNAHVLQIGLTFGDEIKQLYNKVYKKGKLDIYDVSQQQIEIANEKYSHHNITITNYNAALEWDEKYDVVICYNLLHELPLMTRQKVMDNVLNSLAMGGKAIFVDYASPRWWHPLRWFIRLFCLLYQPFTESMWYKPLESFSSKRDEFRWYRTFYAGRAFQKVVAVRKILSNEDVRKLTTLFKQK